MTGFDFDAAEFHFGVNEAGYGIERWWLDGTCAWCLEDVGLVEYCRMTEAEFRAITEAESARLTQREEDDDDA